VVTAAAGVVLRALSAGREDALWWASLTVTSVGGVVATAGLVHGAASLLGRLEGFAEELAVSLEAEVRLAGPTAALSGSTGPRSVTDVLDGRTLSVVLQAVVDLPTGGVVGVEALTRVLGSPPMSPVELFAAAAEAGVSREVELMAVRRALDLLPRLPVDAWLALNVSPATASGAELAELLRHVERRRVVLELTEHTEVESYDTLVDALSRLRDAGVRIAVDDAGAGFSSFRHVIRLHPDIVKLDMSLIAGIDTDPVRRALVSSLVGFTRSIGATVIAEGIETRSEFEVLRSHGVRLGQGYLLGSPRGIADAFTVTLPDTAAARASGQMLGR
jgi:EAL domain-containing protein (putative c-di-GMP-specific phosphodiesterase class I)